jgi:recombination protein RecA
LENPQGNSSGSLGLDFDLGIPFPEGCMHEISGNEGSMKTSIAFEILGQALKRGKFAAYINLENSGSKRSFENVKSVRDQLALDDHKFRMFNVDSGEQALRMLQMFVEQFPGSVVVFDSIDACVPEAVLAKEIGESAVGNLPKLMSDACRKLNVTIKKTGSTIIFINQIREKIGVMFGNPSNTSGGRAVKFYSTQRIEMLAPGKAQVVVDGDGDVIGKLARYKVLKNRYADLISEAQEIPILFGHGIYKAWEIMEKSLELGLLQFGGKGGKQVLLPRRKPREELEDGTLSPIDYFEVDKEQKDSFIPMKRLNAGRRLLLDTNLCDLLELQIMVLVDPLQFAATEEFMEATDDEISDIEGTGGESGDTTEPVSSEESGTK